MSEKTNDTKAIRAGFWYTVSNFIVRGMAFLTMPIFTRIMTKTEVGDFSVLVTWAGLLSVLITLNLSASVVIAKFDFEQDYNKFISTITILGTFTTFTTYAILFPFRDFVINLLGISEEAFHIMFIYLMVCPCTDILLGKFRAEAKYWQSVILSIGSAFITSFLSVILVLNMDDGFKGRMYGNYLPLIVINIVLLVYIIFRGRSFRFVYCKYALFISLPMILHNLASTIMNSSDRIMIQKICSSGDVAVYGVAYSCAMFANIIRNSMNAAWYPWIFEQLHADRENKIKKYSYYYVAIFLIFCIGIILVAPEILYLMGGEGYLEAKDVVPPVVIAYMFAMVYSLYASVEMYYKKQKWFALFSSVCAGINIVLNFAFIPVFGYVAAAYTTMFCCAVECILHYFNVRRMCLDHLYNTGFNLMILVVSVMICICSFFLYRQNIVRFLLIGMIAVGVSVMFIIRRGKVRNLINILKIKRN